MGKAIGYIRVSTKSQAIDGESLEAQKNRIRGWCMMNGMELMDIMADEGVSGTSTKRRDGFAQAVAMAKDGVTLVVYSISRAARSTADLLRTVKAIKEAGGGFASVVEQIDIHSTMGNFFLTVLGAVAELEAATIKERCQLGRDAKKAKGEVIGNHAYGTQLDGEAIVSNTNEQTVIARAHSLKTQGHTLQAIADTLNAEGLFNRRGNPWSRQAVNQTIFKVGVKA
jgi:site-specific DNA recombinase